jgi:hypothetical protein
MSDNAWASLLPDVYEGLESVTATPKGGCSSGWVDAHCKYGDSFESCGVGPGVIACHHGSSEGCDS